MSNETCKVCGRPSIGPRCGGAGPGVMWCSLAVGHGGEHEAWDISDSCHTLGVDDCYRLGYTRELAAREAAEKDAETRLWAEKDRTAAAEAALAAERVANAGLRAEKNGAYAERNQCVALIAKMALALGWRAGVRDHEDKPGESWEADWRNLVCIDLPTGQVSWHFHDSERLLLTGMPTYPASWDGHDTAEKYRRVNDWLPALSAAPPIENEGGAAMRAGEGNLPTPSTAAPPNAMGALRAGGVEQIEYMVQRFLTWKLPANFSPDAGISFKRFGHPASWPIGTNLLDATQATAMVRHMIEGMPHGEALLALEKQLADERQQVDDARQQLYETNEAHNELVAENTRIREERDAYGAENAVLRDALQALLAALIERDHGSHCDGDVVDPFALCILCAEAVDDPGAMPVHDPARACAKAARALLSVVAAPASVPPAAAPQEQQGAAAQSHEPEQGPHDCEWRDCLIDVLELRTCIDEDAEYIAIGKVPECGHPTSPSEDDRKPGDWVAWHTDYPDEGSILLTEYMKHPRESDVAVRDCSGCTLCGAADEHLHRFTPASAASEPKAPLAPAPIVRGEGPR